MNPPDSVRTVLTAVAAVAILALGVVGCTPVGVAVGAGAIAGTAAMEERGIAQAARDKATELEISKKLFDYDLDAFRKLSVEVIEGRVLLTGVTETPEDRLTAVQEAWRTTGVVEVINEVLLGEAVGFFDTSQDVRITAELRSAITFDKEIAAINYSLDAVNGTLYIFGIAQSPEEVDRIKAHARDISRVRRIVTHVLMRDSQRRFDHLEQLEKDRKAREAAEAEAEAAREAAEEAAEDAEAETGAETEEPAE